MYHRFVAMAAMLLAVVFVASHFLGDSAGTDAGASDGQDSPGTCQAAGDDLRECRSLNQQWSGWVFGRMFGVSVPSFDPQAAPSPDLFGWK